jgi:DNA replication protein DnaC
MSSPDPYELDYRQRQIEYRLQALPPALRAVDLDSLDRGGCSKAIDAAKAWATGGGGGLLFTGPVGIGKTTIAAGAAVARIHFNGTWIDWVSATALMAKLAAGFGTADREHAEQWITGTCPIVVDDIDKIRSSEYGAEQVYRLIDGVMMNERPLIVTTNLAMSELAARWPSCGQAITSRLAGYCERLELEGPDRRLRGAG